jgi:hypothetical protein
MTLKSVLLEQLRSTHNRESEWFVPLNKAVAGLTPAEARWTDGSGNNHSVGQLAAHLALWDWQELARFKGDKKPRPLIKNDETFNQYDDKAWNSTVARLDSVMTDWEKTVEAADDQKIALWAAAIAQVGTHNAYHIGQMVYIRKLQGVWDPANGAW